MAFLFSDLELILAGSGARQCWIAGGGAGPVESDRKAGNLSRKMHRAMTISVEFDHVHTPFFHYLPDSISNSFSLST